MKNTKILAAVIFALVLNFSNVSASENKAVAATQLLSEQVTNVFYSAPIEDLLSEKSEKITVHFKVTKDHHLVLIKINGENKDLVRYSTTVLKNRKIKVDPSVEVKTYELPIRFVNQ